MTLQLDNNIIYIEGCPALSVYDFLTYDREDFKACVKTSLRYKADEISKGFAGLTALGFLVEPKPDTGIEKFYDIWSAMMNDAPYIAEWAVNEVEKWH